MNGYVLFCLLICLRKLMNFDACQLNRNKIRVFIIIIIITWLPQFQFHTKRFMDIGHFCQFGYLGVLLHLSLVTLE